MTTLRMGNDWGDQFASKLRIVGNEKSKILLPSVLGTGKIFCLCLFFGLVEEGMLCFWATILSSSQFKIDCLCRYDIYYLCSIITHDLVQINCNATSSII